MDRIIKWHFFELLSSTQDKAKELLKDPQKLYVVSAFEQTAGRGTFGKSWVSPKNSGLYTTFAFCLNTPVPLGTLSHLAACAVCLALAPLNVKIKWPNDILIENKKIAGVLTEVVDGSLYTGIGINLTHDKALYAVEQPHTSYDQYSSPPEPSTLCQTLATHFNHLLSAWEKEGFKAIKNYYLRYFGLLNHNVQIDTPQGSHQGLLVDFSDEGYPILQKGSESIILPLATHIHL